MEGSMEEFILVYLFGIFFEGFYSFFGKLILWDWYVGSLWRSVFRVDYFMGNEGK